MTGEWQKNRSVKKPIKQLKNGLRAFNNHLQMKKIYVFFCLVSLVGITGWSGMVSLVDERTKWQPETNSPATTRSPMVQYLNPVAATGSSGAVVVAEVPLAHTTQFLPLNNKGELVGQGQLKLQVKQVLHNITVALKAARANVHNLVKLNIYLKNNELLPQVQEQLAIYFNKQGKPAVSYVVSDLVHPEALVAMDAIAPTGAVANRPVTFIKTAALYTQAPAAPVAILPAGGVVYVSGQAAKGNLQEATRSTLAQLQATLSHLGLEKQHVVQVKTFVRPITAVRVVEQEIARFFNGATIPPVVHVAWLSPDPVIEIELIAAAPPTAAPATAPLEFITPPFLTASPVFSSVTRLNSGKKIYISGLYGTTANHARDQVTEIFTALGNLLQQAGSDFNHLVKATYYVSSPESSTWLNKIRPQYYHPQKPPAASKALVKAVGLPDREITVDMIGVVAR